MLSHFADQSNCLWVVFSQAVAVTQQSRYQNEATLTGENTQPVFVQIYSHTKDLGNPKKS